MVTLAGSAAFSITADGCTGRALGPGKSCRVTVQYAPINTNGDTGTLTATGERTSTGMNLYGNGSANLVLSPGTRVGTGTHPKNYDYSFQLVSGVPQTFTVSNTGTGTSEALTVANGSDPEFTVSNDTCSGTALAPNGTCTFDVTFMLPNGCTSETLYVGAFDIFGTGPSFAFYIHLEADQQCP